MPQNKTTDAVKLLLRLPKGLHRRLQQQARGNNTSLNTEIINQLEGSEAAAVERVAEKVADKVAAKFGVNVATGALLDVLHASPAERDWEAIKLVLKRLNGEDVVPPAEIKQSLHRLEVLLLGDKSEGALPAESEQAPVSPDRGLTPERIQQIKNLVERGTSREQIAELIGVSVGSLQVVCSRLGVSLRPPNVKQIADRPGSQSRADVLPEGHAEATPASQPARLMDRLRQRATARPRTIPKKNEASSA